MAALAPAELLRSFSQVVPLKTIRSALEATGKQGRRQRDLPAVLVVQLVICLGLLRDVASRQVLAYLLPAGKRLPGKQAVSRARYRIGARPLMTLFALVARCLATPASLPQAFHRGLRLTALDATDAHLPTRRTMSGFSVDAKPRAGGRLSLKPKSSRCWRSGPTRSWIWWSVHIAAMNWRRD